MTYDLSKLIHPPEFFTDAYLEARRAEYGFTQLSKVKTFLWDFELYGHLQERLQGKLILKGGAAAQLHFAPKEQRTSVDIDAIFTGSETELTSALDEIHTQFGGDTNFFKFNKHTPKNPTRLLPLLTYFVAVPDPIDAEVAKKQINIKIDFHMLDKLESKTVLLSGANALGVPLAFTPRCLSVESLVGDKILTLARGSVGIPAEREADLPKQLYDLHHLISLDSFRSSADTVLGFKDFLSHELASFHAPVETDEILSQVAANLRRYATVSRSTADREALKVLKEFRGNYEPIPFRSLVEWELTAKRLEYFSYCFLVTPEESISLLRKADQLAEKITLLDKIEARRIRLLDMLRLIVTAMESKAVRNAPLERIFWELMATGKATVEEIQNKLAD